MANFDKAFQRTSKFEGGYVNDPDDNGGETYNGISRKSNPSWLGWKIVDEQKKKSNFPNNLKERKAELLPLEKKLYKEDYWDKVWGDKINKQEVADDMYDTAVNMGISASVKLSERLFKMKETGKMNEELLKHLNKVV